MEITSTENKKIGLYKKLLTIQQRVVALKKDTKGNNYEYVSGDKVLSNVKEVMNEVGLLLKTEIVKIKNVRHDYVTSKGSAKSEVFTTIKMVFTWIDTNTGESEACQWASNGQNDWDKGLGSAATYGERYFLLKFFHIETDKDDIDNPKRKAEEAKEHEENNKAWLDAVNSAKDLLALKDLLGQKPPQNITKVINEKIQFFGKFVERLDKATGIEDINALLDVVVGEGATHCKGILHKKAKGAFGFDYSAEDAKYINPNG